MLTTYQKYLVTMDQKLREMGFIKPDGERLFLCDNWNFFKDQMTSGDTTYVSASGKEEQKPGRLYGVCGGRILYSFRRYCSTSGAVAKPNEYYQVNNGFAMVIKPKDERHNEHLELVWVG